MNKEKKPVNNEKKRRISGTSFPAKLYVGDLRHIRRTKDDRGATRGTFASISGIIRHYVHLGINAEKSLDDDRYTIKDRLVRESFTTLIRDEAKPTTEKINNVEKTIKELADQLESIRNDSTNAYLKIERKLEEKFDGFENASGETIPADKNQPNIFEEMTLKNLIILRSILYIFLLAFHNKANPTEKDGSGIWFNIIKIAHEDAAQLSKGELEKLNESDLEEYILSSSKLIYKNAYNQMIPPTASKR